MCYVADANLIQRNMRKLGNFIDAFGLDGAIIGWQLCFYADANLIGRNVRSSKNFQRFYAGV